MYRSSKTFNNLPCAHRRHAHDGHCAHVHGYSRSFTIWFECSARTKDTGFVMDFGALKGIKKWLESKFDHTLLLDSDDPLLPVFRLLENQGACKLVVFEDVGMEGTAKYVFDYVDRDVRARTSERVWVHSVECRENDKNSAIFIKSDI